MQSEELLANGNLDLKSLLLQRRGLAKNSSEGKSKREHLAVKEEFTMPLC